MDVDQSFSGLKGVIQRLVESVAVEARQRVGTIEAVGIVPQPWRTALGKKGLDQGANHPNRPVTYSLVSLDLGLLKISLVSLYSAK